MQVATDSSGPARRLPESAIDWQSPADIDEVMQAVLGCRAYPADDGPVDLVQTHISSVFLSPRFVFKFKRPVDVGFTDFRTLRQRHHFCRQEVRLNRRLAPGVYLEVLPLWLDDGRLRFEPGGTLVDYAVVMKRLERECMMDHLVVSGSLTPEHLDGVARRLADFHKNSSHRKTSRKKNSEKNSRPKNHRGGDTIARFGGLDVLIRNWEENFAQVEPYLNVTIARHDFESLQQGVFSFLTRNRALLEQRVRDGFIRDGHGDLRCEHVYLGKEIKIIDCIEFNDRFRYGDVASDLSFLLMDLAALGHPEWSRHLLSRYMEFSEDSGMIRLVPFYACYRAFVRGKVLSMKLSDKHLPLADQHRIQERAQGFFALAMDFSRQMPPPVLLLLAGLMGTGKTALGQAVSGRTGMPMLSSDAIRKELAAGEEAGSATPPSKSASRRAAYGEGLYSQAWSERTYHALLERGGRHLQAGRSVILDASFSRREFRQRAYALARQHGAEAFLVECSLREAEIRKRLGRRRRAGRALSDGRVELLARQKADFEPITELERKRHLVVRTDKPPGAVAEQVLAHPGLKVPQPLLSAGPDESA